MTEPSVQVEDTTVDALIVQYPTTMAVFNAFGVDGCCGAHRTVRDAAAEDGVDVAALVAGLRQAIDTAEAQ
ncbi:MAG: DUF542 domain-containing protein [Gemmatimonadetes bacterium]|nr:DUF542 domain-containing protein [Gemmatimonadota bacterium]MCC6773272.1 DUF542 domain-containing protein [Gemmatimonadaceae bacterium]